MAWPLSLNISAFGSSSSTPRDSQPQGFPFSQNSGSSGTSPFSVFSSASAAQQQTSFPFGSAASQPAAAASPFGSSSTGLSFGTLSTSTSFISLFGSSNPTASPASSANLFSGISTTFSMIGPGSSPPPGFSFGTPAYSSSLLFGTPASSSSPLFGTPASSSSSPAPSFPTSSLFGASSSSSSAITSSIPIPLLLGTASSSASATAAPSFPTTAPSFPSVTQSSTSAFSTTTTSKISSSSPSLSYAAHSPFGNNTLFSTPSTGTTSSVTATSTTAVPAALQAGFSFTNQASTGFSFTNPASSASQPSFSFPSAGSTAASSTFNAPGSAGASNLFCSSLGSSAAPSIFTAATSVTTSSATVSAATTMPPAAASALFSSQASTSTASTLSFPAFGVTTASTATITASNGLLGFKMPTTTTPTHSSTSVVTSSPLQSTPSAMGFDISTSVFANASVPISTTSQAFSSVVGAASDGAATSITLTTSQAPKLRSQIVRNSVEEVINDWNAELQDHTAKFQKQETTIIEWDRRILQNRDILIRPEDYFDRRNEAKDLVCLNKATVTRVEVVGIGDCVCVDICSLMQPGEGLLVGSFARGLFLVHSECLESNYIASRPFRVNAGPVHAYVAIPGGRTCYLSELQAGKKVLVVGQHGLQRMVIVGRVRIESRPLILVEAKVDIVHETYSIFLQNAETVGLVRPSEVDTSTRTMIPVTSLKVGDQVMLGVQDGAHHTGIEIQEFIVEK